MKRIKIIDTFERKFLAEGRTKGVGHQFLKKLNDKTFEAINPISACKDFLNDIIYTEHTKKDYAIYGQVSKYTGIFENTDYAYLSMSILKQKHGGEFKSYTNYLSDIKYLETNSNNLLKFINYFEDKLKLNNKTNITKIKKNFYLLECPIFWCKYTYLISLYTLLMRIGVYWDGIQNIDNYLADGKYNDEDKMYIKSEAIKNKLERLYAGELPAQNLLTTSNPHSLGIVVYNFPIIPKIIKEVNNRDKIEVNIKNNHSTIPFTGITEKQIDNIWGDVKV